jgi:predicted TIM-barrel fold metal-dependent hydrolase
MTAPRTSQQVAPGDRTYRVIDAAVHPTIRDIGELRAYMDEPWRSRAYPRLGGFSYIPPFDEFPSRFAPGGIHAGSDPVAVRRHLFEEAGIDLAILLPLVRGLMPDVEMADALCSATNAWLADVWLSKHDSDSRFRGTIRVNPSNPAHAVEEIRRWADHPKMVQIGVPLQSHQPYGNRVYLPIWEEAAARGLPVAIHHESAPGIDFWPTWGGFPRLFSEFDALKGAAAISHLTSFIAEGVFERLPDLKIVFADGGHDLCAPFMWRFDKDWRPYLLEIPWVRSTPSSYLDRHVRFCSHANEGPIRPEDADEWLAVAGEGLLIYSSNYPYWDFQDPGSLYPEASPAKRERILGGNASDWFGLAPTKTGGA